MAAGEDRSAVVGELSERYSLERPAIYRALRRGGILPAYKDPEEKREELEARPRVESEPCFMCGVRPDIGCRHRRTYE
jgi:hypothetical protein